MRSGMAYQIRLSVDDWCAVQIEALTDQFTAIASGPREIAWLAAEAQLEVMRVQQARIETINRNVRKAIEQCGGRLKRRGSKSRLPSPKTLPT